MGVGLSTRKRSTSFFTWTVRDHTGPSSVVDPYSFFTDPDPDPDPEFDVGDQYGSRALMTKN
jgi:hypothetical protein